MQSVVVTGVSTGIGWGITKVLFSQERSEVERFFRDMHDVKWAELKRIGVTFA